VFVFGTIEIHSGRFIRTFLVFVFTGCAVVFLAEIAVKSASAKSPCGICENARTHHLLWLIIGSCQIDASM
jgi:hypothetical protein